MTKAIFSRVVLFVISAFCLFLSACATPLTPGPSAFESFDGNLVAYHVHPATKPSSKPRLLLIHGWSCDKSYWDKQIPALSEYDTITIDLPGHGQSGSTRRSWQVQDYGKDVSALVKHLKLKKVILVGHSMGAPVALHTSARIGSKSQGIVAVDSLHNVESKFDEEQWDQIVANFEKDFKNSMAGFVSFMIPKEADPKLIEHITKDMSQAPPLVAIGLLHDFGRENLAEALEAANAPVRCINAANPPTSVDINKKHEANFGLETLSGVGHFLHMEKPQEFNAKFLKVLQELSEQ